jgi:hypothetical protein
MSLTPRPHSDPRIRLVVLAAVLAIGAIGALTGGDPGLGIFCLVLAAVMDAYAVLVWTWRIRFYALPFGAVRVSESGGHRALRARRQPKP